MLYDRDENVTNRVTYDNVPSIIAAGRGRKGQSRRSGVSRWTESTEASGAKLKLHLLGSPRVELDGTPIQVDTRKAIALLAYLAVVESRHSRDELAALFWPDSDQSGARAAFRRTLSALHRAIDGAWLEIDRDTLALQRQDSLWIDLDEFQRRLAICRRHPHPPGATCAACQAPLDEAVALYRDDFLAGFSLRDSPGFDDWQFAQAESLRRELASALERLIQCQIAANQLEPAIATARRWLALDPLHEPAHCQLIELFGLTGQRSAATRQYRECVRILDDELGVAPLESTTQLHESIKASRPTGPAASPRRLTRTWEASSPRADAARSALEPRPGLPAASFPLVGRSAEWEILLRDYTNIRGGGHFTAIVGEAGIGKTRLAEEFVTEVQAQGAVVLRARCYEGETNLAYAPFAEALRAAMREPECARRLAGQTGYWLGEAARLVPEINSNHPDVPPPPPLANPGGHIRFFEGIRETVRAICDGPAPGVLWIDDAHWADAASIDLLAYIVRRVADQPLDVLVTWRQEEVIGTHHLRRLLVDAERAGIGTEISLGRLDATAVQQLIAFSAARSGQRLTDHLFQETEGLPFLLIEYLTAMGQDGARDNDTRTSDWWLSRGARDLLHSRLSAVSGTGTQLLHAAAVIGRSFDFDTLRETSGRGEDETVAALEELIYRGLVREVPEAGASLPRISAGLPYDFSHEKLRSLVYEETGQARRRLLHRRIAAALVARARTSHDSGSVAGQVASHYRLAGDFQEAADYFRLAGEHARSLYANGEALTHFQTALALTQRSQADTATLHEAIGDLQTLAGEYSAAIASYQRALSHGRAEDGVEVERKLGSVYLRRGDWDLADEQFRDATLTLGAGDRPAELSRIFADWSLLAYRRGETVRALDLARRALEQAETAGKPYAVAQAHNILGILASSQGDLAQALVHLEQSLALADEGPDVGARIAALNNLAHVHGANRDYEQAIRLAETSLALCATLGDRHREAALHNNLADLLHAASRSDESMAHLKRAVTIFAEIGADAGALQPEIWKLTEW